MQSGIHGDDFGSCCANLRHNCRILIPKDEDMIVCNHHDWAWASGPQSLWRCAFALDCFGSKLGNLWWSTVWKSMNKYHLNMLCKDNNFTYETWTKLMLRDPKWRDFDLTLADSCLAVKRFRFWHLGCVFLFGSAIESLEIGDELWFQMFWVDKWNWNYISCWAHW